MGRCKKGMTALDRFEEKVVRIPFDTCWWWIGSRNPDGYGSFWFEEKIVRAHQVSYRMFVGEITPGLKVLHSCDEPSCVNPRHLRLGTQKENVQDAIKRGRWPMGLNKHNAKLSPEDAAQIKKLRRQGMKYDDLCEKFGVTHGAIQGVLRGASYAYVKEAE